MEGEKNNMTDQQIIDFILGIVAESDIVKAKGARQKLLIRDGSVGFYTKDGLLIRGLWFQETGFKVVKAEKWVKTGCRNHDGFYRDIALPDRYKPLVEQLT